MKAENATLKTENATLKSENEALKTEDKALETEIEALETENEALKAQCEDMKREAAISTGKLEQAAAMAVTAVEQLSPDDDDEDGTKVSSVNAQPENGVNSKSKISKKVCI